MKSFLFDETGRLRTAWRFALFGLGYVAIQIGVMAVVIVWAVLQERSQGAQFASADDVVRMFERRQMPLMLIGALPITACVLGLIRVCRRHLDRRSIESLGFVRPGRSLTESVAGGLVFGTLPIALVIVVLLAIGGLTWEGISASAQTGLLVPALVVMAFHEEIVFRSYLLQNLVDIGRPIGGVVFTSTLFWMFHGLNPSAWSSPLVALNLFGAGVVFALARFASGNIWFPTALHFGWNFAEGVLFDVPISGLSTDGLFDVQVVASAPNWLTGGTFGIEASILVTVAEIGLSIFLGRAISKKRLRTGMSGMALATGEFGIGR